MKRINTPNQRDDSVHPTPLAGTLTALFHDAEMRRRDVEERWLKDLRQYKGVYDPDVAGRIHPRRSRAFLRLTRAKVKLADARLMDLLFPGSGENNWSIRPTPQPEIPDWRQSRLLAELAATLGRSPSVQEIEQAVSQDAAAACTAMERLMRDQLAESRYREVVRDVVHSGNLYGTGVLKGPLIESRRTNRWKRTSRGWQCGHVETLRPFMEFVPVWDLYPDMTARRIEEARFIFQRHVMSKFDLAVLAARPDFDGPEILAYLEDQPEGDANSKTHESQLSDMGGEGGRVADGQRRYEVLEFWGHVDGELLAGHGVDVDPELLGQELPATVWLAGGRIIKAAASPLEGVAWPFAFYYFDKDETSIFGEGLAAIMRDPQQLFNASVRALLDNAAIAAGPQIEVNQDLLPEHEDPTDIYPFRIWLRSGRGIDAQYPAVRVSTLPSHAEEFMAMARLFESYAHETTGIPSAMHGELESAANTATGLSMLLNAASVPLRDQVKHFDDGITRPFITALYHWNMQFSDEEAVKGDYAVEARGWTSLVARETAIQQLDAFASSTSNPLDSPWVRRGELLKRRAMARGLGSDIIREDIEVRALGADPTR